MSENSASSKQFGELVGQSRPMLRLFEDLERIAGTDMTVYIQGETGTGKDVAARELHRRSRRANKPFVVLDCAGLPESLIEAELFGYERGAFTGATETHQGAFETANGGTLFIDEIGELPLHLQTKLLRVLEARQVKRLGGSEWHPVDIRIISATHRSLFSLVSQGTFRQDLYFRLAVAEVAMPPLRERTSDLPLLVENILERLGVSDRALLAPEVIDRLRTNPWPGNVRELRNVIERATILGTDSIDADLSARQMLDLGKTPYRIAKQDAIAHFQERYMTAILAECKGNVREAAKTADVDPAWIFRVVKRSKIDLKQFRTKRASLRAAKSRPAR